MMQKIFSKHGSDRTLFFIILHFPTNEIVRTFSFFANTKTKKGISDRKKDMLLERNGYSFGCFCKEWLDRKGQNKTLSEKKSKWFSTMEEILRMQKMVPNTIVNSILLPPNVISLGWNSMSEFIANRRRSRMMKKLAKKKQQSSFVGNDELLPSIKWPEPKKGEIATCSVFYGKTKAILFFQQNMFEQAQKSSLLKWFVMRSHISQDVWNLKNQGRPRFSFNTALEGGTSDFLCWRHKNRSEIDRRVNVPRRAAWWWFGNGHIVCDEILRRIHILKYPTMTVLLSWFNFHRLHRLQINQNT